MGPFARNVNVIAGTSNGPSFVLFQAPVFAKKNRGRQIVAIEEGIGSCQSAQNLQYID